MPPDVNPKPSLNAFDVFNVKKSCWLVIVDDVAKKGTYPVVPDGVHLLLNVVQSVVDKTPLFVALAVGKLNVCVDVALLMFTSVPLVPVAKVCVPAVNPFKSVIPPVDNDNKSYQIEWKRERQALTDEEIAKNKEQIRLLIENIGEPIKSGVDYEHKNKVMSQARMIKRAETA